MDGLLRDLRHALRSSLHRPTLLAVAVVSVAVGIGVNAAVFAVVDGLAKDLPGVSEPDRVVEIYRLENGNWGGFAYPDLVDLREQAESFEAIAGVDLQPMSLSDEESGERILGLHVTSGYFEVMGVRPFMGRTILPEEDRGPGQHPVAVLSYRAWERRYGADPDIVGNTIRLNREVYTVVGVAPPEFPGHLFGVRPEVFVPLTQSEAGRRSDMFWEYRGTLWLQVVGRLRDDITLAQANAELTTIFARLADVYPESNAGRSAVAAQAGLIPAEGRAPFKAIVIVLGAMLLLVLAATCANVAGMLLAKAAARERDIALRAALGAGRARLVGHLVSEAFLIFFLGGTGGVLIAAWALKMFDPNRLLPVPFPVAFDIRVGWHAVAFGAGLTLVTALVFGVLPALKVARTDLAAMLRDLGGGSGLRAGRLRRVFVGGQVGVSILLLATGGLFVRSLQQAGDVEVGFEPEGVYLTSFDLSLEGYRSADDALPFVDNLVARVASVPGVTGVTVATDLPLDGGSSSQSVLAEDREPIAGAWVQAYHGSVTPGYFETLGIRRLQGRLFGSEDGRTTMRVTVINSTLADMLWPDADPLGKRIQYGLDNAWHTVIGVVQDTKPDMITDGDSPQVYGLLSQEYKPDVHLAVRYAGVDTDASGLVSQAIRAEDPALAMNPVRPLSSFAALGTLPHRLGATAATVLGGLALLLSAMGIYGIVAFYAVQRTREIGVRMALGAPRRSVLIMIVRQGLALALPGAVIGATIAIALGKLLGAFLFGISPVDAQVFGGIVLVLAVLVTVASFFPARRASSVHPAEALRYD